MTTLLSDSSGQGYYHHFTSSLTSTHNDRDSYSLICSRKGRKSLFTTWTNIFEKNIKIKGRFGNAVDRVFPRWTLPKWTSQVNLTRVKFSVTKGFLRHWIFCCSFLMWELTGIVSKYPNILYLKLCYWLILRS